MEKDEIMIKKPKNIHEACKIIYDLEAEFNLACPIWSVVDVQQQAEENNRPVTMDEAGEIIRQIREYHDCEYGITWMTLECGIDDAIENRVDPRIAEFTARIDEATGYLNMAIDQSNDEIQITLRKNIKQLKQQRDDIIKGVV